MPTPYRTGFLTRSILTVLALLLSAAGLAAQTPPDRPGPAVDTLYFRAFDVDRAARDLQAGNMDLYMFSLKTDAARQLQGDPRFSLYEAPASTVSILLNPAPAPRGELNPFSIREVRQAMQYLVDREFVARDIYRGMAVPMISHVTPTDYDYLTVSDIEKSYGIEYDPEFGRELIAEAMEDAGARLENGIWSFRGRPIRITLIGRVEDERRNVADLLRVELERAGFQVAISYRTFAAAVLSTYSTDPQVFEWHIYTEGWGRSAPSRYDYATVNTMAAPWLGNLPGWQEIGFWQYENDELDELGQRLFRGEFASRSERDEIYRRMTELSLDESVRLWVVTATNSFATQRSLTGVSEDLVAGLRAPWTLREAYIPGQSELTVGHLWVWTERTTWNPIGGISDVYSSDIWRYLSDPGIWNHPFTGIPEPMRLSFDVETAGPTGSLRVPGDAVAWNSRRDRWDEVGSGVSAVSKVTFDFSRYFQSTWHHGEPISMADVIYSIALGFDRAYDQDKARIEVAAAVTARPFLETYRGFRILDDNRLEVYVDYWHFEESFIASYASPSSVSTPWEILAAMDDLVFQQRRAAYSDTAAGRFNVPWISLVMERDARLVQRTLRSLSGSNSVPDGVFQIGGRTLVSQAEAEERYQASLDWFDERGHLVVSNGPYSLWRYDPPAQYAELRAFREPNYPFRPGDWLFGAPPGLTITPPASARVVAGDDIDLEVNVAGPGAVGLRYLLVDPVDRSVVTEGEATTLGGGRFSVELDGRDTETLFPGLYELNLLAYSDSIARVEERTVDFDVE